MKRALLFFSLIVILVLGACTPAVSKSSDAAQPAVVQPAQPVQQAAETVQQRTISVNGSGQVTLSPDVAYVYIGVHSQSQNVADALNENNSKAQAVAASLKELNIDPKDIQTSSFSIYPQQQTSPQGEPTGQTLYNVDNLVYVTVRDLQVLGKLLDVVVRSGANSINGITFDVLDKSNALAEARRLAIQSAKTQAEEIAKESGVTLGELQSISAYSTSPQTPVFEGKGAAMGGSSVPISAGQMILRVDVNAAYIIR